MRASACRPGLRPTLPAVPPAPRRSSPAARGPAAGRARLVVAAATGGMHRRLPANMQDQLQVRGGCKAGAWVAQGRWETSGHMGSAQADCALVPDLPAQNQNQNQAALEPGGERCLVRPCRLSLRAGRDLSLSSRWHERCSTLKQVGTHCGGTEPAAGSSDQCGRGALPSPAGAPS